MTPEEAVRSYVYHPQAEELPPFDDRQAYCYEAEPDAYEHDRLAHWLANTFLALAIFGFGFFIGKSLP